MEPTPSQTAGQAISNLLSYANDAEVTSTSQSGKQNPALENKDYRQKHVTKESTCVVKLVTNARIYGTRGTGGSRLAKSAIRLAIDTGVIKPASHLTSSVKAGERVKPIIISDNLGYLEAVKLLDEFEKKRGGQMTSSFKEKMTLYQRQKHDALVELEIKLDSSGRPLFQNETQQESYFKIMEKFSFPYYEAYLSVNPKDIRATRSKVFRAMSFNEIQRIILCRSAGN